MSLSRFADEHTRVWGREASIAFSYPTAGWLFIHGQRATRAIRGSGSFSFSQPTQGWESNPRTYPHAMEGK